MFEDLIEKRKQELLVKIRPETEFVKLSEIIANTEVSAAYKCFFSAEADWWIYEEQIRRNAIDRFDFSDDKLAAVLRNLDELFKKNARFSIDDLKSIAQNAVEIRLNFLIRPRTALKWFVYRWEQTKSICEIKRRLNYFSDYDYLTSGIANEIRCLADAKISNSQIGLGHFVKIITEIDSKFIDDTTPETFIRLMDPLFAFFNPEADFRDTEKIPAEAVIIFMRDKNLNGIAGRLEELYHRGELPFISKKYLLGFIYQSLYDTDIVFGGAGDRISGITNELVLSNIAAAKEKPVFLRRDD